MAKKEVKCAVKAKIIDELRKQDEMKASKANGGSSLDFSSDPLCKQLEFAMGKIQDAEASGKINENMADLFKIQLMDIRDSGKDEEERRMEIGRVIGRVINS